MVAKRINDISSLLLSLSIMLDPTNSILGLKIPVFGLYILTLALTHKPNFKYVQILLGLIVIQILSLLTGYLDGQSFNSEITSQFIIYVILFVSLFWEKNIDIMKPVLISSVIVSVITIIGFVAMTSYPELEIALSEFSIAHDYTFMMSSREFLGIEFTSFFYKSIPLVTIPAAYLFDSYINSAKKNRWKLVLVILFVAALFCAGNRSMIFISVMLLFVVSYKKMSQYKLFKPVLLFIIVAIIYVAYLSVTEKGEASNDMKYLHLKSYAEYFSNKWYMLLLGSGPGSMFYSAGYAKMTGLTEWTYIELVRMYGIIGFFCYLRFFFIPLRNYKYRRKIIMNWRSVMIGYIFYLLACIANPYLICSTGFLCVLLVHSIAYNKIYRFDNICKV